MSLVVSHRFHQISAIGLLVLVTWTAVQLMFSYLTARLSLSSEIDDMQSSFEQILHRRVDLSSLQEQFSRLNTSDVLRRSALEAQNDRAALVSLEQLSRAAIEGAHGKLLSTIEAKTNPSSDSVAVLIRARLPEDSIAQFLSNVESGSPRITAEEITFAVNPKKPGDVADIEVTATLRVAWMAPSKP